MAPTTIPIMDQNLQLHHFTLSENETNVAIIARMRDLAFENTSAISNLAKKILYALLMRDLVVGKGIILEPTDLEAQPITARGVYKVKKDDTLTTLVFGGVPIPEPGSVYAYLVEGVQEQHAGYVEVWCFYRAVSARAASMWLLVALGVAVMFGVGVGLGVGNGQLGLDVGSGVLAIFTGVHLSIVLGMIY